MSRRSKLAIVVMAVAIVPLVCACDADAGWRWGGSCGSWGGYGYRSHGGSWGSYGSRGSWGSYGSRGSWGSYGSRGSWGSYGGYYPSYGRYVHGRYYGQYHAAMPVGYRGYVRQVVRPVTSLVSAGTTRTERAAVAVHVPENAAVYVNGTPTKSTGEQRVYLSSLLHQGEAARFEIRAVVDHGGQVTDETKVVTVGAGGRQQLSFDLGPPESVETALILNVPADAVVQIEGRESSKTGPRRVFTTQRLSAGKTFDGLTVRVTLDQHGKIVSQEEQITLHGGKRHELTFEFDDATIAQR